MNYKIVVLDLDGTLTNNKKEITPHTREVLMSFQKSGGIVVLASGRPTYGVDPLAKELELSRYGGYLLSFNGALITECATGNLIYEQWLPKEIPATAAALARKYQTAILTYRDSNILTETPENQYVQKESYCTKMHIQKIDCFEKEITFPVVKCLMLERGVYLAEVEKKVQEYFGDSLSIFRSEPYFLEIMPKGIDKAKSLARLLEYLHMTREEMIAFGDGFNDKSMLMFAGLGVAMQNGQPAVKAVADLIAPSNEDDGVAYVVESLMLGKTPADIAGYF
ncbi:MAG: Cof-type HAD-IIB family hydrolase [Fusicatenibacter sp.]